MKYGYIRVSTKDQQIDRQLTAMYEEGIRKKELYIDKMSGRLQQNSLQKNDKRLKK